MCITGIDNISCAMDRKVGKFDCYHFAYSNNITRMDASHVGNPKQRYKDADCLDKSCKVYKDADHFTISASNREATSCEYNMAVDRIMCERSDGCTVKE